MNRSRRSRAVADRADASSDTERLGDLPHAKGTIVWTLCRLDIVLTPYEAATLSAPYQPIVDRYAYTDWEGRVVLCWEHGRYINHSCDPVMVGIGNEIEIAVRDIAAGDELHLRVRNALSDSDDGMPLRIVRLSGRRWARRSCGTLAGARPQGRDGADERPLRAAALATLCPRCWTFLGLGGWPGGPSQSARSLDRSLTRGANWMIRGYE